MDDDGSLGIRNWGFFEPQSRIHGLQLTSSVSSDGNTKQLLSNGPFMHQHHHGQHVPQHAHHHRRDEGGAPSGVPAEDPSLPMNIVRNDTWVHQPHHPREPKIPHMLAAGQAGHAVHGGHHEPSGYGMVLGMHTPQMIQLAEPQPVPPPKDERISTPLIEENAGVLNEPPPPKKRQQRRQPKSLKPKKIAASRDDEDPKGPGPAPSKRGPKKHVEMVINGIDFDLSRIPTPVCSCTGSPRYCYRWGAGGWQSACCTTTISTYPLPMSTKRRAARIAGRKMSHGAFRKVLEKLTGEGYNLNIPIDLKTFWAKHGTNKFVTIR